MSFVPHIRPRSDRHCEKVGRSGRIWTCDPLVPNEVRYLTAPHSDKAAPFSEREDDLQASPRHYAPAFYRSHILQFAYIRLI